MRARLAALSQGRHGELGTEKDPGQVHGAEAVPFVEARLLDALPEEHAGIVDENIEPAPSRDRRTDRTAPVFLAGNVEVVKDRRRVTPSDLASGFPPALVEDVTDDDPCSRLDHQPGGFGPDSARSTRDQSDLTVEAVHHCLLIEFFENFSERRVQQFETEIDFALARRQRRGNAHDTVGCAGAHDIGA